MYYKGWCHTLYLEEGQPYQPSVLYFDLADLTEVAARFLINLCFSNTVRASHETSVSFHLEEGSSKQLSLLHLYLYLTAHTFVKICIELSDSASFSGA